MGKCTKLAHVRNSNGEVVESNLFKDLLFHLPNRGLAKEYYSVGTNKDFLDGVKDRAQFDENGEITFASLLKLANIDLREEALLNNLNREIKAGKYDYPQAISRLQSFNRNSQFKDKYMATIKYSNDGKFELKVIPRTTADESALHEEIRKRSLQERLMYHLNKAGVDVSFIERDDRLKGRYSTVNADKTADGLYQLIRIVNGDSVTETLAEEAGHFVIGALGNSPLVNRLMEILTPEVQKEALGDELNDKVMGSNSRREVAGTLVGKALINNLADKTPWQKLTHRVANLARKVFSIFRNNNVAYRATLEAKEIADKIAADFMSNNFSGTIENALNTKETLYSATSSANTKLYRETINRLNIAVTELKNVENNIFAEKILSILGVSESGRSNLINSGTFLSDSIALDGITEALVLIADMMGPGKELDRMLKSIDFQNVGNFYEKMASNGRTLRQIHTFVTTSLALQQIIDEACVEVGGERALKGNIDHVQLTDDLGNVISVDLTQVLSQLASANKVLMAELFQKERQFFCKFCEDTLGSKYVERSARVLFKKNGSWGLSFAEADKLNVSDALTFMESDITFFERHLASMSNSSDLIGQIADKATKAANKMADDLTNQCWDQLRVLEARWKKLKIPDMNIIFERSERDGKFTGNIISEFNWGDYEADWKEFKEAELERFKQSLPNIDQLSEFEVAVQWDRWFRPLAKAWHKTNSRYDQDLERYVPGDIYLSSTYDDIIRHYPGLEGWLESYKDLKKDLDARIPEGSTTPVRAPQFKGRFINRVKNQDVSKGKAIKHALRGMLLDTFCESSEDTDYGSDQTYNSEEEELFANALAHEKEKIHRLPLFGINKLQDMTELSTDLFQSTLAYASMANSHLAMSQIVDTLEVGKSVLLRRTVEGQRTEEQRLGNKSKAYNRYLKFLDKQVYGISSTKHKIYKGIILEKVIGAITSLASKYFLGGNVVGGAVNTMTGFNEIFKEAMSEEFFSLKDFQKANRLYFGSFVDNWLEGGKDIKNNKVSLFIRHFNVLNDSRQNHRNWESDRNAWTRAYNMFSESLFFPYKSGDHYMSSMSYLALASKIKLYDKHGTRISLYDAYKEVDNEDVYGNKAGKTLALDEVYFKTDEGRQTYDIINSITSKLEASAASPFGSVINLTTEEQDYITNKGYSLASTDDTLALLAQDAEDLTWNAMDESAFMDKAREINIRMHGIYNNQDKVAFSQNWYGNAVLAMRGYALGMLERRFGANKYSVTLGQDSEGSLNTLAKVLASTFTDRGGFALTCRALLLPLGKKSAQAMYAAGFSPNQAKNMRRNFGDMLLIGLLSLLRCIGSLGEDEEDDEVKIALGLLYYFSNRLYREQSAFNNPLGWYYEMNTVLDIMPVGMGALIDMGKTGAQIVGLPFADKSNPFFYYQSKKKGFYQKYDSKGWNHMKRMTPYLRSYYTIAHPYEAAKSYEYGRNVKAR